MHCEACGSPDTRPSFVRHGFTHRECLRCGLLFVWPTPDPAELRRAHDPDHAHGGEPLSAARWEGAHRHLARTWAELLETIRATAGPGPLLDVGCGTGQFLAFAAEAGWPDLLGLEPAPEAAARARRVTTAPIVEAEIQDAGLPAARFAGILAWDVVEHVPHLRPFLAEAARLLRPGGVLAVATVHRGGPALRVFGRRAMVVHPPEHLRYFTRASLRAALAGAGLPVARLWTQDVYLREWTRAWTRAAARPPAAEPAAYRRAYDRVTTSSLLSGLVVAANVLLRATSLGDVLIAVARRPPAAGG
jgi:SAM-dependent methyltransferase